MSKTHNQVFLEIEGPALTDQNINSTEKPI